MVDVLPRLEPVGSGPAVHAGVTIALRPPVQRWSLRAREAAALETRLGRKLPDRIGETLDDIACLGPDEWLWRSAAASPQDPGAGLPLSIVDVSERSVGFIVEGRQARAVLNAGCPLDLERFAVGRTTRTAYEGVEIILHRESDQRWTIDVWRSFSEWMWLHLNTAAAHP
jgi:sarcosine oxidase subunit gamma